MGAGPVKGDVELQSRLDKALDAIDSALYIVRSSFGGDCHVYVQEQDINGDNDIVNVDDKIMRLEEALKRGLTGAEYHE